MTAAVKIGRFSGLPVGCNFRDYSDAFHARLNAGIASARTRSRDSAPLASVTEKKSPPPFFNPMARKPTPAAKPKPTPIPVPAAIEALGPAAASSFRKGFSAATDRMFRLAKNPATRGRHIAMARLASVGLSDQQIIDRLSIEPTDRDLRAADVWNRAIALNHGDQPQPPMSRNPKSGAVWDQAIANNRLGAF